MKKPRKIQRNNALRMALIGRGLIMPATPDSFAARGFDYAAMAMRNFPLWYRVKKVFPMPTNK